MNMTTITMTTKAIPMLDDFVMRAALAGIGVALATGPLGCFVVWRRMAYFGDAISHAAILGVAASLMFSVSIFGGVLLVALVMAAMIALLSDRGIAADTLLGVLSHAALAFGLIAVSFISGARIDLMAYLFGDILAVGKSDLAVIWLGALSVIGVIGWRWQRLVLTTLSADLARASGLRPRHEQFVLTLALALVVAIAIKAVGALLIVAMLVIPAAASRALARTPEAMALGAIGVGIAAVGLGLQASLWWDTPTGPSIVAAAAIIFAVGQVVAALRR
jgi:zinc transport system permease protein